MPPPGTTRKRTRSVFTDDQPSAKKARLGDTPSTAADAPDGSAAASTGRGRRSASGSKDAGVVLDGDSVYDVPTSDNEERRHIAPSKKNQRSPATRASRNVYEVPESEDELSMPIVEKNHLPNPTEQPQSAKTSASKRRGRSGNANGDETPDVPVDVLAPDMVNGSGRRRRVKSGKLIEDEALETTHGGPAPTTTKGSATKKRGRPRKATADDTINGSPVPITKAAKKPSIWELRRAGTRGLVPNAANGQAPVGPGQTAPQPLIPESTPGGRQRHTDLALDGDTPKLKGILTPSRKDGTPRARKSVAFNSGSKAPEVFFEDLPSKSTGKKAVKSPKESKKIVVAQEAAVDENGDIQMQEEVQVEVENAEDADEEVCSICKKPDSKKGNEIIFCDGCDMAVHQKCYNVPTIPKGDWLCRNCSQEDAIIIQVNGQKQPSLTLALQAEPVPHIPDFAEHLRLMQRVLIDRCTGRKPIPLQGQDDAYEKAFQLVEQTVLAGEGNSMLVIGARGSGKTTLVESIVSKMSADHKDEFHVVRLNGFIHTDDKIALKEIWRQLGKEMDVEDDLINRTNNYADTLASLLAVLSHPSEILDTQQGVTSKSVVFIIDEFDLFATHARQTLLYNLFDIAQARKAPIAVLGLTTRIDVVESLEKRVKSRFSHRYVYLSLARSLPAFWDICRHGLTLESGDLAAEGIDVSRKGLSTFLGWWEKRIQALHKDPAFQDHLEYYFHTSKSVSAFLATCILPLASLSPTSLSLKPHFSSPATRTALDAPDSKLHLLPSLSDLDLSLLIAAARLDIVAHTDTVNFAMAYDEYTSLMGRQRVQSASSGLLALGGGARVWGRGVAGVSWERLVTLGLLVPAGFAGRGGGAAGAGLEGKMWKVDVALEEIPACVKLNQVLGRWCREI